MRQENAIQVSLLDRLIDLQPDVSSEAVQKRSQSFQEGKKAVMRDLANLLNTKSSVDEVPQTYRQVEKSVFLYGLLDFTSLNPKSKKVRQRIVDDIVRAIALFEPRLQNVSIQIDQSKDTTNRSLRFKIAAMLVLDPLSQPIQFDTYFDINKNMYVVTE